MNGIGILIGGIIIYIAGAIVVLSFCKVSAGAEDRARRRYGRETNVPGDTDSGSGAGREPGAS